MLNKLTVTVLAVASLAVASEAPTPQPLRGTIDVVSFGTAQLAVEGAEISALHARIMFASRDRLPWTFDVASTRAVLADNIAIAPLFANSDSAVPLVRIGPREHRIVDVYFALPSWVAGDDQLDELALQYRVSTPDHRYEGKVVLRRVAAPPLAEPAPPPGWGAHWWAVRDYDWPSYDHRDGRLVPRPPRAIVIAGGLRSLYEAGPAAAAESWPRTDECDQW